VECRQEHWIIIKHILRNICGMITYGSRYDSNNDVQLHGFTYSDWEGSVDDRNITSGMCFNLGSSMISWARKKQKFVTLNTAKVEYIAAYDACTKVVWLCKLFFGLFDQVLDWTMVYCDN
jgi:hypothetical protein